MGIPERRLDVPVSHDLLHSHEIHAGHDPPACGRMAERMPTGTLNPRSPQGRLIGSTFKRSGIQRMISPSDSGEDIGRGEKALQGAKELLSPVTQWNMASLPTFGHGDGQHSVLEIDMIPSKRELLTLSEPAGAGDIHVNATETVSLSGAGTGLFSETSGAGPAGTIDIHAGAVRLSTGAQISSSSRFGPFGDTPTGSAGNITINAGNQFAMTNSSVTTEATQSGGGAIKITTNPNGTVQLTDSLISASVSDGTGGGGSVNIDPQYVLLQNSQILANAKFGPGGNIFITTNLLLPDATSVISASSQFGQNGTITIQSPNAPASGKIQPLGKSRLLPTSLLTQRCAALAGGEISSFTVAGRDSLPAEPGGWLSSPLALAISETGGGTLTGSGTRVSQSESAGETTPLLSLRRIAPLGFLTQSFAVDWSGCTS
jgi:large exoprotein involved in heme utilization and adhesion